MPIGISFFGAKRQLTNKDKAWRFSSSNPQKAATSIQRCQGVYCSSCRNDFCSNQTNDFDGVIFEIECVKGHFKDLKKVCIKCPWGPGSPNVK